MPRPKKEPFNHGDRYEKKIKIEYPFGVVKRESFYSLISIDDCIRQAQEKQRNIDKGKFKVENTPFDEFARKWLENFKAHTVSKSTYEYTYKNSVETHIIPYFKGYSLTSIKTSDIQAFFNSKVNTSDSLLHKLKITLTAIFDSAVDDDLIYKNPMRSKSFTVPPSTKAKKERHAYTKDEARKLTDFAKAFDGGYAVILVLKTGLRRGELLGLRWRDIDFKNKVLHVRQAVKETRGVVEIGKPKTANSIRDIPLDAETIKILKSVPKEVTRYKGKKPNKVPYTVVNEYVVPNSSGVAMRPTNWSKREYKEIMDAFHEKYPKIDALSVHELRHTYGTLLYKSGTDIYTIQKLLGHSSVDVTTSIYVHNDLETIKKAIRQDW